MFTTKGLIFSNNYWKGPNVLTCYNKGRIKLQYLQERTKYITMVATNNYITMITKDQFYYNTHNKRSIVLQYLKQRIKYNTILTSKDYIFYNL